jgi:hypothetical protein
MAEENANPATPAETTPETTPQTPAATPGEKEESTVTLSKEEHAQLLRDQARAGTNQRKADLYDRTVGKNGNAFKPSAPPVVLTPDEKEQQGILEDQKAQRLLTGVALDPKYRDLLDADPTLRGLLVNQPLAVIPLLAPDALDAQDALELVQAQLDERLEALKAKITPATTEATPETAPPAGAVNTQTADKDAELEAARKIGNTEGAIASMVKVGLKHIGKS